MVLHSTSPEWKEKHEFLAPEQICRAAYRAEVFDKRQEIGVEVIDRNSLFLPNATRPTLR